MVEYAILKYLLQNRAVYNKYYNYINIKYIKDNYKDIYKLFIGIDKYYTNNKEATSLTLAELEATVLSMYPMMKDVERGLLSTLLHQIDSNNSQEESIVEYLRQHRNRSIAGELAIVAFDVSEGRKIFSALEEVYDKFEQERTREQGNLYVSTSLSKLLLSVSGDNGLRWRLPWLNQSLGSLRKGDFGFVFARPETGKTTFLASEVSYFAEQTDKPILWCNNEEGGDKVNVRCYQASLGITLEQLRANPEQCEAEFMQKTGGRINIYDDGAMTRHNIEERCRELQPGLIILDQIDKIKGFTSDRYDLQMKEIYQWARELAKKYCPVIGICQAGGTGDGVKWLNMNHVDSSHTAKQGEADFILGIGKVYDEGMGDVRFLNISKNKLIGDDDSIPDFRHGKIECVIKPEIARYEAV